MQHGRATSVFGARSFLGRSRTMSLLMALFFFAGIALAIPGFVARADEGIPGYATPEGKNLRIALVDNSGFAAEFAATGYWGVILDSGRVTPLERATFTRLGERITVAEQELWAAESLNNLVLDVEFPMVRTTLSR